MPVHWHPTFAKKAAAVFLSLAVLRLWSTRHQIDVYLCEFSLTTWLDVNIVMSIICMSDIMFKIKNITTSRNFGIVVSTRPLNRQPAGVSTLFGNFTQVSRVHLQVDFSGKYIVV